MKSPNQINNPDILLIGGGIMSATLGAMLKELDPTSSIQLYEMTDEFGEEASNGWVNAVLLPLGSRQLEMLSGPWAQLLKPVTSEVVSKKRVTTPLTAAPVSKCEPCEPMTQFLQFSENL